MLPTEASAFLSALFVGLLVGTLFVKLGLPVPTPPTIAGVLGVIGTVLGMYVGAFIIGVRL